MSTRKGSSTKKGPPKHVNKTAWTGMTKWRTDSKAKIIKNMQVRQVFQVVRLPNFHIDIVEKWNLKAVYRISLRINYTQICIEMFNVH